MNKMEMMSTLVVSAVSAVVIVATLGLLWRLNRGWLESAGQGVETVATVAAMAAVLGVVLGVVAPVQARIYDTKDRHSWFPYRVTEAQRQADAEVAELRARQERMVDLPIEVIDEEQTSEGGVTTLRRTDRVTFPDGSVTDFSYMATWDSRDLAGMTNVEFGGYSYDPGAE